VHCQHTIAGNRWLEATRYATIALFAWLISHQPAVLLSQNKPATNNQPTVLFSQNKAASAISHQPNEQAAGLICGCFPILTCLVNQS
jgi:hypothetical protein